MENSHAWLGASTSASIAGKSGKYTFFLFNFIYNIYTIVFKCTFWFIYLQQEKNNFFLSLYLLYQFKYVFV